MALTDFEKQQLDEYCRVNKITQLLILQLLDKIERKVDDNQALIISK